MNDRRVGRRERQSRRSATARKVVVGVGITGAAGAALAIGLGTAAAQGTPTDTHAGNPGTTRDQYPDSGTAQQFGQDQLAGPAQQSGGSSHGQSSGS